MDIILMDSQNSENLDGILMEETLDLVIFTHPDCNPSKSLLKSISETPKRFSENPELYCINVPISDHPKLAEIYKIKCTPTSFLIKGDVRDQFHGNSKKLDFKSIGISIKIK